jgi:hypothetical protein
MARYGHPSEDAARSRLLGAFELDLQTKEAVWGFICQRNRLR